VPSAAIDLDSGKPVVAAIVPVDALEPGPAAPNRALVRVVLALAVTGPEIATTTVVQTVMITVVSLRPAGDHLVHVDRPGSLPVFAQLGICVSPLAAVYFESPPAVARDDCIVRVID
jgi:hypothetical protein